MPRTADKPIRAMQNRSRKAKRVSKKEVEKLLKLHNKE